MEKKQKFEVGQRVRVISGANIEKYNKQEGTIFEILKDTGRKNRNIRL